MLSLQINLGIYIQDNNTELSVLVDRAVGGSSIVDGQIELMLHRSVLASEISKDYNYIIRKWIKLIFFMFHFVHNKSLFCFPILQEAAT